jgi:hypothetical protein
MGSLGLAVDPICLDDGSFHTERDFLVRRSLVAEFHSDVTTLELLLICFPPLTASLGALPAWWLTWPCEGALRRKSIFLLKAITEGMA